MKKNYKRNWLFKLKTAFVFGSLLFAGSAMAQLSGTYTINSASSTSGTNYSSFGAFASAINSSGVSGPVTVNVVKGSGPYVEKVTFTASGTSSNTITINGNGETIRNTGTIIYMNGADYFTFDNLDIVNTGTGTGTRCFTFKGGANYNTIKNSNLTISSYTSTSNSTAYVAFSNSLTGRSTGNHGSYNVIENNVMSNGTSSSAGPYYGVMDYRSSSTKGIGNIVKDNDIHDIYYYAMYNYYVEGFQFNNNDVKFRSNANYGYVVYGYQCSTSSLQIQANDNVVENQSLGYYFYGIYFYYTSGTSSLPAQQNGNRFSDITASYYVYSVRAYYYSGNAEIIGNELYKCSAGYYVYGPYAYYSDNVVVSENTVHDNTASYGVYGIYFYYANESQLVNNTVYNNKGGYYNYGMISGYSNDVLIAHNTLVMNTDVDYYIYGLYHYNYNVPTNVNIKNNITYITGTSNFNYTHYGIYCPYNTTSMDFENNVMYATTPTGYYAMSSLYNAWSGWINNSGAEGDVFADPMFGGITKGDIKPTNPKIANMGTPDLAKLDYDGVTRTACGPDPGAYEFFIDHSVSNLGTIPTSICGNQSTDISLDITNGASVKLYDLGVFYSVNGQTTDAVVDSIDASTKANYKFEMSPVFHTPGDNIIEVGLLCDDDASNNILTHTINVIASPQGSALSQGATFNGYYNTGDVLDPDATVKTYICDYDISRPAKYTSAGPGADYTYSLSAMDDNMMDVTTAGFNYTGSDEYFSINPDDSLAGRTIFMEVTTLDNNTGCDSTFGRYVYVPHVPVPSFNASNICLGDVAQFKNTTTLGGTTGYILTNWEFDDPDPSVTDDNSDIKDGFWQYTTYGKDVQVVMTVSNGNFPLFERNDTNLINVTPKPEVDFKVLNACEGSPIRINNNTTLPVANTITYEWDFGGEATYASKEPSHTFSTPGQRKITVVASSNGCSAALTKNAYQFEMPTASYTSEGECNFVNVDFMNTSTIANGANMGFAWDFNGEGISRESDPSFAFATPGTKTVTLTATSEFGCVNIYTGQVSLKESPEADFSWDAACNLTPINFTITGSLPDGGANSSYEWDFAGEASAQQADPSHLFAKVGPKIVKLTISDLNGCSSSIVKEVNVVLQAIADFDISSICEGDEAVFTNKSTVAAGNLTYEWTFGDGATSTDLSPTHNYASAKSYNVKLKAIVEGGCSDEVTYPIVVNPAPDVTFTVNKDGRTVVCDGPTGNDVYRWTFGDGSKDQSEDPTYTYENVDNGTFTICLATKKGECWNDACEDITINLAGIEDLTQNNDMISVYPNPTSGKFNVVVENANNVVVKVGDILGNVLDVNVIDNLNGTYGVDMSAVADGVYFVQVKNDNFYATKRITVSK